MEFKCTISGIFSMSDFSSLLVALFATFLCISVVIVLILRRARLQRSPSQLGDLMPSVCVGEQSLIESGDGRTVLVGGAENGGKMEEVETSMLEQLMPEVVMYTLSFLDYQSLCRLSMASSMMRDVANDEITWRALYLKDFTLEQQNVKPANGWKAYYAATIGIVHINADFFRIVKERSHTAMSQFWLNAGYVKCFHATGQSFTGYNEVMESWRAAFSWENVSNFQIRDVRTRVLTDMAWVTMKAFVDMERAYNVTNIYELCNGRWYMVHHHSLAALIHGGADQQFV